MKKCLINTVSSIPSGQWSGAGRFLTTWGASLLSQPSLASPFELKKPSLQTQVPLARSQTKFCASVPAHPGFFAIRHAWQAYSEFRFLIYFIYYISVINFENFTVCVSVKSSLIQIEIQSIINSSQEIIKLIKSLLRKKHFMRTKLSSHIKIDSFVWFVCWISILNFKFDFRWFYFSILFFTQKCSLTTSMSESLKLCSCLKLLTRHSNF